MRAHPIDRRIADLLNDPLTALVMQADGVDRERLAAQLRRIAEPSRAVATHPRDRDEETSWNGFGLLPAALFGACLA